MGWKIMRIRPTKNPSSNLVLFETNITGPLTVQPRGRPKRATDGVLCENRCIASSSRPFVVRWGDKQLLRGSHTSAKLTVGLYPNGIPYSNLFKGCLGVPGWTASSTNSAGVLVVKEMQQEVAGRLKKVRNHVLYREFIYCRT